MLRPLIVLAVRLAAAVLIELGIEIRACACGCEYIFAVPVASRRIYYDRHHRFDHHNERRRG